MDDEGTGPRSRPAPDGAGPLRVVVLGGGYAGLFAAQRAAGGARRVDLEVTVVDPAAAWVERTRMHQVALGDASVVRRPLGELFRGTRIRTVAGRATDIDLEARKVLVETDDGTGVRLPFDRLVYALGSTTDTTTVPGAAEHAFVVDGTPAAERLRDALRALPTGPAARAVVVGGGLTGVETATEIAGAHPGTPVVLLTAGEVGAGLSARGRRYLVGALSRHGVELREHTPVAEVHRAGVRTGDGEQIVADVVVWAAGLTVPDLARRAGLSTDEQGRVRVDATLRSLSHPVVSAAGDSARPVDGVGVTEVRPSAYTASITGAQAGANIARELRGRPPRRLRFGYLMQSISLGRRDGLVQFTDGDDRPLPLVLTGRVAAATKEFVERIVVVGSLRLERILPGVYAWRPAPLTGRRSAR